MCCPLKGLVLSGLGSGWRSADHRGRAADAVLDRPFAVEEGMPERAARNRDEAKGGEGDLPRRGPAGDTRGAAPGTKWCAANAVAEYAESGRSYTRRSNQVHAASRTPGSKQRGLELLLAA